MDLQLPIADCRFGLHEEKWVVCFYLSSLCLRASVVKENSLSSFGQGRTGWNGRKGCSSLPHQCVLSILPCPQPYESAELHRVHRDQARQSPAASVAQHFPRYLRAGKRLPEN